MTSKNCHLDSTLLRKKIGFIGAGNMAQAIIYGLIKAGVEPEQIYCANPSSGKLDNLKAQQAAVNVDTDNSKIADQSDILLLAVKPQFMSQALASIASLDLKNKLIISVAAGVETESIESQLQQPIALIRSMPNTPATIGLGATGLFANSKVTMAQRQQAEAIFNAVGITAWLEQESQMDLVTAISGSGPAHYFLFLEAVIQSAIAQGMEPETAKQLAVQTAVGAASMASQNINDDIAQLRANVTSPGGTTAAAIESFQSNDFIEIIDSAVKASVARGKELAELAKDN